MQDARLRGVASLAMLPRDREEPLQTKAIRACLAAMPLTMGLSALAAEGAGREWQGRYRYEHDAGLTEGGSSVQVVYDLAIGPAGAPGGCLLSARGFQIDERIVCQTKAEGQNLTVSFHRYEDGRTVNRYGVAVYRPGESLFTLSRAEGAGLLTRWQALEPDGESVPRSGAFFTRLR